MSNAKLLQFSDLAAQYQLLKVQNPIKCGEMLLGLKKKGLTQTHIAEKLKANRQMIGRYLRMANWDADIKRLATKNLNVIGRTQILRAAEKALSKTELIQLFSGGEAGDIAEECSTERYLPAENDRYQRDVPIDVRSNADISWGELAGALSKPVSVILGICIFLLSAYLLHQGYIFFLAIDTNSISAVSSAMMSEAVPLILAACLALNSKSLGKNFFLTTCLLASIIGVGLFMHASLDRRSTENSSEFRQRQFETKVLNSSIASLSESLKELPRSFVSKRQNLVSQIDAQRAAVNNMPTKLLQASSGAQHRYSVWLRIAAMLLNAFLTHMFFSFLRDRLQREAR